MEITKFRGGAMLLTPQLKRELPGSIVPVVYLGRQQPGAARNQNRC